MIGAGDIKPLKIGIVCCTFFFVSSFSVSADTLFLKGGRHIEGTIDREDGRSVELNLGFGTVVFNRGEIDQIVRSNLDQSQELWKRWADERQTRRAKSEQEMKMIAERRHRETVQEKRLRLLKEQEVQGAKDIPLSDDKKSLIVEAILNEKIQARMVLDTGASIVLLTKASAGKLGIDPEDPHYRKIKIQVADGRQLDAVLIKLDRIEVGEAAANNIEAAILIDSVYQIQYQDGLLGMSFLKNFHVTIDYDAKKISLEKLPADS